MKGANILLTLVLLLCTTTAFAEDIKVGGGGASIASVFVPTHEAFEKASGMQLYTIQSSPKIGLIELVKGTLDVATAAVPLDTMIKGAEKDGVKIDPASLDIMSVSRK
jgi:phosphate transport system substrate-binding protein